MTETRTLELRDEEKACRADHVWECRRPPSDSRTLSEVCSSYTLYAHPCELSEQVTGG